MSIKGLVAAKWCLDLGEKHCPATHESIRILNVGNCQLRDINDTTETSRVGIRETETVFFGNTEPSLSTHEIVWRTLSNQMDGPVTCHFSSTEIVPP